jgi:hypothetical protein
MRRALIAIAAVTASASAASADVYNCRSVNEPKYPVTANFELKCDDPCFVTRADLQIEDDIGYSTTATHPSALVTITDLEVDSGRIEFNFHQHDAEYDGDVATLDVVSLSEGIYSLTGGVLQVGGGGLWTIQCDVTYDHPYDH